MVSHQVSQDLQVRSCQSHIFLSPAEYAAYAQSQSRSSPAPGPSMGQPALQQRNGFAQSYNRFGGGGMGGMGMMNNSMMYNQQPMGLEQQDKGKGKIVELNDEDWQAQFDRVGESIQKEPQTDKVVDQSLSVDGEKTTNLLDGEINLDASEADHELLQSLEQTWSNLKQTLNEQSTISDEEMAQWESQYGSQFMDNTGLDYEDDGVTDTRIQWTKENIDNFLKEELAYPFQETNDYMTHPDPFAEGQRLLAEGAPLSEAGLAFEAACRLDPSRAEAWKAAGETWAADEREVKGIRALEKAVACGGSDGVGAWMVSTFFQPNYISLTVEQC